MATRNIPRKTTRGKRHRRIRSRLRGNRARPRLSVFRSDKHIVAQLIDDALGHTLLFVSDRDVGKGSKNPKEIALLVGKMLAERAKEAGIFEAVFDRGGFMYHGRIRSLADGARKAGLKF